MKKFIPLLIMFLCCNCVFARDYTKIQEKELKQSQKYGTTAKYLNHCDNKKDSNIKYVSKQNITDPKILIIGDYKKIDDEKYYNKLNMDDEDYSKIKKSFTVRSIDNYNSQAKGEDYYKIYRIAERIIRANKLDYMNWRIGMYRDSKNPNAYNTNLNYIAISTSLYDSFYDNEDALAFIIGHEIGHSLLGHQQRLSELRQRLKKLAKYNGAIENTTYLIMRRKLIIDSKNAEFAADVEGLKLAAKAGYNVNNSMELFSFFNSYANLGDFDSDHPNINKRIENYNTAKRLIPMEQWVAWGKYNIYNSDVLNVNISSDRASFVIIGAPEKDKDQYYHPETFEEYYLRCAYAKYIEGDFKKSAEYFDKYFKLNNTNSIGYLYAAYAYSALAENSKDEKYQTTALSYAQKAYDLDKKNTYAKKLLKDLK